MRVFTATKLLSVGAAIAIMAAAPAAQAVTYEFIKDANLRASTTGVFTHNNSATAGNFTAGIFDSNLKQDGVSYAQASLCAEIVENLNNAPPPELFVKKITDINGTEAGRQMTLLSNRFQIAYLVATYLPGLRNNANSVANSEKNAGLQAAIWSLWGLGIGTVTGNVLTQQALFLADAAANAGVGTYDTAVWVYDLDNGAVGDGNWQNQLMNVPEPAFYQMAALLGLGGFGILRLRRRSK